MNRGIVITSHADNEAWLTDLIESIKDAEYDIRIVMNGVNKDNSAKVGRSFQQATKNVNLRKTRVSLSLKDDNEFELGGIERGKYWYDEFIYLMDTCIIKDITLFDKLFETPGNVFLSESGYHYMGKFVSKDLPEIPKVTNKQQAIEWERKWLPKGSYTVFDPILPWQSDVFEERHGRKNMVLENDFITKYKATWS